MTGLTNGVRYVFGMRAVDGDDWSGGSDLVSARPSELLPAQPSGLVAEVGDTRVGLSWDDPDDVSVTGYQYRQQEGADGTFGGWGDVPGSDAGTVVYLVTGLTNGVVYTFGVRAVDTFGASDSSEVSVVPLPLVPGQLTGLSAGVNNARVTLNWDAPVDVSSPVANYQLLGLFETSELLAGDGVGYDRFGYSVAIDDNTAVIGAHGTSSGSGSVYVYTKGWSGRWSQTAKLVASDGQPGDSFGFSVAVDADTDTVVVGAYGNDDNGSDSGSVYVFTKSSDGGWVQDTKLVSSDGEEGDWFGVSVAVDQNTVLVGAPQDRNNIGDDIGSVYVFSKGSDGGWRQTAKLVSSDGGEDDWFGVSVAVDQNTAVVGAVGNNHDSGADSGSVYVFTKNPDRGWVTATETAKLTGSDSAAGDNFGISVAVDSDTNTVVVGAYGNDHNNSSGADSGSVYVFTKNPDRGWVTSDRNG